MMEFLNALKESAPSLYIRNSLYVFPIFESIHVMGLTLVFGTIAIMDLRLLGLAWTSRPFSRVKADVLKWTWLAFAVTLVTGATMFITNAPAYYGNLQFRMKMLCIALAGVNMVIFELTTGRKAHHWDNHRSGPAAARLAGALSLLLWLSVIFFGRWIGFTVGGENSAPVSTTPDPGIEDIFK
jgi:hypothetical protein